MQIFDATSLLLDIYLLEINVHFPLRDLYTNIKTLFIILYPGNQIFNSRRYLHVVSECVNIPDLHG